MSRSPLHVPLVALLALAPLAGEAGAQLPLHRWIGDRDEVLGFSARDAGDVDGDGRSDVVLGGGTALPFGPASRRSVRVRSGATGDLLLELPPLLPDSAFGWAVEGLDDVDGDARADFVVGAPGFDAGTGVVGAVTAHSGASGALLWQRTGTQAGVLFGYVLARTGDLDGDGLRDVVVGGIEATPSSAVSVRALSGGTGATIWSASGTPGEGYGRPLVALGDVDGDGLDDLGVGAPAFGSGGLTPRGAVHVLSGADGATLRVIEGGFGDRLGLVIAGPGDVDGDGRADLATTASSAPVGIRLYSAQTGALIRTLSTGGTVGGLGAAGDVDGDGTADLLASNVDGAAQVISGLDGARLRLFLLHLPLADVFTLSLAGDLDGDGRRDFLVGGLEVDPLTGATPGGGEVLAYSGAPPGDVVSTCFGDGSGAICPCGNPGSVGAGCGLFQHPFELRGARLLAEGSTSASADDLRFLLHTQAQGQPALLLAGTAQLAPTPFEAGLLCAGGALTRLALREDVPGYTTFGPGLRAIGGWSAGERRTFQVWYRVPREQQPCTFTDSTNLSSAVSVHFGP